MAYILTSGPVLYSGGEAGAVSKILKSVQFSVLLPYE